MNDPLEDPPDGSNDLRIPFIFVRHGDPEPAEWLARHPGAIRIPAVFVPHGRSGGGGRIEADWSSALMKILGREDGAGDAFDAQIATEDRGKFLPTWQEAFGARPSVELASAPDRPQSQPGQRSPLPEDAHSKPEHKKLTPAESLREARMRALLRLIRWEENGPVSDDVAYHARIGGRDPMTDQDMLNYVAKPEHLRIRHGKQEVYTAAGAYQIIQDPWIHISQILGVSDFTPQNQDRVAEYIIRDAHAGSDIEAGRLPAAIHKLNQQWTSLPGGSQSHTSLAAAKAKFEMYLKEELTRISDEQINAKE